MQPTYKRNNPPESPSSDVTWSTSSPALVSQIQATHHVLDSDIDGMVSEEYDRILSGMQAVAHISRDMQLMVSAQSGLLDRIDYNLETAGEKTRAAVQVISDRGQREQLDRRKLVVLFLIVMIIILSTAVILKPKK
jgi:hypothetical protein